MKSLFFLQWVCLSVYLIYSFLMKGHGVTLTATWLLPALMPGTWHEGDFPKSPTPNSPIPLPRFRPFSMEPFEPPTTTTTTTTTTTPAMSMTTMTDDDDRATSVYATPMSSIISLYPAPDAVDENSVVDLFLASSSTAWSASPFPPPHQPISSPTHYPTTPLPNSPITPNSLPTTPVAHQFLQSLPSTTSTSSSVPFSLKNPSTTLLPSPRIRKPRFSTRMGSSLPPIQVSSSSNIGGSPPHLIMHNNTSIIPPLSPPITPISTSTPIPIPPTPIDLPPIPPITPLSPPPEQLQLQLQEQLQQEQIPLCPTLVNQLLRGPVLQTVPLPDVDDDDDG